MKKLTAQLFYRNKAVKVIYMHENKRLSIYYAVPDEANIITVKEINKSFMFNPENVTFDKKKFPTIITNYKEPYVINPYDTIDILDHNGEEYTSDRLNVAVSAKIGRDIFINGNGADLNLGVILSIVAVLGVIVTIYLLVTQNQDLSEQLNQLKQALQDMANNGGVTP